jgi:hypothetical protein
MPQSHACTLVLVQCHAVSVSVQSQFPNLAAACLGIYRLGLAFTEILDECVHYPGILNVLYSLSRLVAGQHVNSRKKRNIRAVRMKLTFAWNWEYMATCRCLQYKATICLGIWPNTYKQILTDTRKQQSDSRLSTWKCTQCKHGYWYRSHVVNCNRRAASSFLSIYLTTLELGVACSGS